MIRTQIYLPDETHDSLLHLARQTGTTMSHLVRQGVEHIVERHASKQSRQKAALEFFANPPKKFQIKLSKPAHILVREDRD